MGKRDGDGPLVAYRKYGDRRTLEESLPAMARYVDYLGNKAQNYIISYGLGDWYDIGPGGAGGFEAHPAGGDGNRHVLSGSARNGAGEPPAGPPGGSRSYGARGARQGGLIEAFGSENGTVLYGKPDRASDAPGDGHLPPRREHPGG